MTRYAAMSGAEGIPIKKMNASICVDTFRELQQTIQQLIELLSALAIQQETYP